MRSKYVEERHRPWFVFGESVDHVDISDGERDVLERVPRALAKTIIDERNDLVEALVQLALAFSEAAPEAFDAFWYGKPQPQADSSAP